MPRARRTTVLALIVAAVVAAATGITYAATTITTSVVYACTNAKGTLRLLSHGACPDGYQKVGINKRGPRGPRGYRGPRGLIGSTGPAGPGAVALRAYSTSQTTGSQTVAIPGMGLSAIAVCGAGDGNTTSFYLEDEDASADYDVAGDYDFTPAGSGFAFVLYAGNVVNPPHLSSGMGPVEYTQPASLHTLSEFVVRNNAGGGQLRADVAVRRSGKTLLVHLYLYQANDHCFVQADLTPTG